MKLIKYAFDKPFLSVVVTIIVIVAVIHLINALTEGIGMEYYETTYSSDKITDSLDGYTIAFVADVHDYPNKKLTKIVSNINERNVDMLLLGGDFSRKKDVTNNSLTILSKVNTADGIYGVGGNNDVRNDLFKSMEANGIVPLRNKGIHVKEGFYLAGVEDLMKSYPDIELAMEDALSDDITLLISHNPDVSMLNNVSGVDVMLSGHTHGGQITFFGVWAPALTLTKRITKYGQKFMSGWVEVEGGCKVFVSRGIGGHYGVRTFAKPQVVYLTLMKSDEGI